MMYSIPVKKVEKLRKIINRYNKKGANITFNVGEEVVENGTLYLEDKVNHTVRNVPIQVTCKKVFVEGSYRINGWSFVGTIEFTENGNIIRLANSSFEGKVPEKYLHTPQICEHCGTIRNRKDTYLIYNENNNEFKQVGSKCLLDYTQGLDANACANIMSCLNQVASLESFDCDMDSFFGNGYDSTSYGFDRKYILPVVYSYVTKYGYQKMSAGEGTAHDVYVVATKNFGRDDELLEKRANSLTPASEDEINAIDDFAKQHALDDLGYMRNASLSWLKRNIEYRDFGLVASFVNTYNKEVKKIEKINSKLADASNVWVGNIGDRITIKVASLRLLYSNSIEIAWRTYAETYCYEIKDEEGHTYIWKSSKNLEEVYNENLDRFVELGKVLEIVGTIKEHSTYCGTRQTVITRGKVTKREEN